ncbi:MAG: hypothetical protein FWG50_10040 [Kiritimatiellaeota bacterium]|nr:hypothetical protein [Kiritimatiellota bacterium]
MTGIHRYALAPICAAALLAAGCIVNQSPQQAPQAPPPPKLATPPPTEVTMTVEAPTLFPHPASKPTQEADGLVITVEPVPFELAETGIRNMGEIPADPDGYWNRLYWRKFRPTFKVTSDSLKFQVRIVNNTGRTFRGYGMRVQFNVAGRTVATEPSGTAEIENLIVTPRTEQTILIYGPKRATLPNDCAVRLFFNDVIIKADADGNVLSKHTFDWAFNYAMKPVEKKVTETTEAVMR